MTAVETLLKIVRSPGIELFHNPAGECFVTFPMRGHMETARVRSGHFRQWLNFVFFRLKGAAPPENAIATVLPTVEAFALFQGACHDTHVRVARGDGTVFIDLGDPDWRMLIIGKDGWKVGYDPSVRFVRFPGYLPLPEPQRPGSFEDIRHFTVLRGEGFDLLRGFVLGCCCADIPYPILCLVGEAGSTKSSLTRLVKSVIDPAKPMFTTAPMSERDLLIAAQHGHLLCFDNLSSIPLWLSDAFCRVATGGGLRVRTLYENDEETLFEARRPVVVNSIGHTIMQADLLDRSIVIDVPPVADDEKVDETILWKNFAAAHPRILAGLADLISAGLQKPQPRKKPALRMQDFASFVTRIEPVPGAFVKAWTSNRAESDRALLDFSPLAEALLHLMDDRDAWQGTHSELLTALTELTPPSTVKARSWPKSARSLSVTLKKLSPALRKNGISVEPEGREGGTGRRLLRISKICVTCVTPSQNEVSSQFASQKQAAQDQQDSWNFSPSRDDVTQNSENCDGCSDELIIEEDSF